LYVYALNSVTITVSIPIDFPAKQPLIILQATIQNNNGKPITTVLDNWPYSPRWPAEEIAKRARLFITNAFEPFRKLCLKENEPT
jgi:hypothetical protein